MPVDIPTLSSEENYGMRGQPIIQLKELEIDHHRYAEYKLMIQTPRPRRGAWRVKSGVTFRETIERD